MIGEVEGIEFGSAISGDFDEVPICQNFTDWSQAAEIKEVGEENVKEVISLECPIRVSMRQGFELVMSQT